MSFVDIYERLDGVEDFDLNVNNRTVVVRRVTSDQWRVYLDENLIGSFVRHTKDRATFFESEIASEPGETNWVSDDVTVVGEISVPVQ